MRRFGFFFYVLCSITLCANAQATPDSLVTGNDGTQVIEDDYIGGKPGNSDVVGDASRFQIERMIVSEGSDQNGKTLNVTIQGNYFPVAGAKEPHNPYASGIYPGDLLMTTSHRQYTNAFGVDDYAGHTLNNWTFAAILGGYDNLENSGEILLYSIDESNLLTGSYQGGVAHDGQYFAVDQDTLTANNVLLGTGYWFFDTIDGVRQDKLTFVLPWDLLGAMGVDDILSFRWAMSCGNDVIEGSVKFDSSSEVPEPATMTLLTLAALSGSVFRRRVRQQA